MSNEYPILLRGEKKGILTVTQEGLNTVFAAKCEDPGRLLRLSVYGDSREGYLGVMQPENGVLRLTKRLSRTAMSAFPGKIEYAGEAGQTPRPKTEEKTGPESAEPIPTKAKEPPPVRPRESAPPRPKEPANARPRGRSTDIIWYKVGDGSLYTVWNDQPYRAIPLSAWGLPMDKAERRTIEGVEYAVFPLKDGKII